MPTQINEDGTPVVAPTGPVQIDENGNPITDWRSSPTAKTTADVAALGARSGIRALLGLPDLAASIVQSTPASSPYDLISSETGVAPPADAPAPTGRTGEPFVPSEAVIHGISAATGKPLELSSDASPAMQKADQILPWLIPTGNQISRVKEAPGLFNKAMTFSRSELGSATDWFLSDEGQQWARDHGMGPVAQTIAGMIGGSARHAGSATVAPVVQKVTERPGGESGANYDVNKNIGVTAPLKSVADPDFELWQDQLRR